jgi:hypothetical protein
VVGGRQIAPLRCARVDEEIAVIDAIGMFIQKNINI